MRYYTLYEGQDSNDNAMVTDFRSKTKALVAFKNSRYAYAVLHQYEGQIVDGSYDGDYQDTIAEK